MDNQYALNSNDDLVFIDDVKRGEKYTCPCCGEKMIVKKKKSIFEHESKKTCENYHNTILYLLSKEIVKERKKLYLPAYSNEKYVCVLSEYNENIVEINGGPYKFTDIYPNPGEIENGLKVDLICEDKKHNFILLVDISIDDCIVDSNKLTRIKWYYNYNYLKIIIPSTIETKTELERYLIDEFGVVYEKECNKRVAVQLKYFLNYPYGDEECKKLFNHYKGRLKYIYDSRPIDNAKACEYCFKNIILQGFFTALKNNLENANINEGYRFIWDFKKIISVVEYLNSFNLNYFPISENDDIDPYDDTPKLLVGLNTLLRYYYKYKPMNGRTWNCENIRGIVNGATYCTGAEKALHKFELYQDRIKKGKPEKATKAMKKAMEDAMKVKIPMPKFKF